MKISETRDRVRVHTADWKNRRIDRKMEMSIWCFAQNPDQIDDRLGDSIGNGTSNAAWNRMPPLLR